MPFFLSRLGSGRQLIATDTLSITYAVMCDANSLRRQDGR